MVKVIAVPEAVFKLVADKRDEYARMNEFGRSPVGRNPSMPKVIDFAVQLVNWIDNNRDDEHAQGLLSKFKYDAQVKRPGRPYSNKKVLNAITPGTMDIIMNRFRAQGIMSPTNEQIVEMITNHKQAGQPIGRNPRKGAKLARKKMNEILTDPTAQRLDVETGKVKK